MDLIFDFLNHIRQNWEVDAIQQDSISINDESARRPIKLPDHPSLKNLGTNSRPTFASIFDMMISEPKSPPLIQASAASEHLQETVRIQRTVTEIETNRRGDVLLNFDSPEQVFTAVILLVPKQKSRRFSRLICARKPTSLSGWMGIRSH
jgi:hypothetical protein